MAKPFVAKDAAVALYNATSLPILVGAAVDDGEGGVFVQVGYADFAVEDVEHVVRVMLRDLRAQSENDFHDCEDCRRRLARIKDAIAVLERDGHRPTGRTRGAHH